MAANTERLAVLASTVAFLGVLLTYALLVPQYQAPDEPEHVDAVLRLVRSESWSLGARTDLSVVASREAAGFRDLPLAADDARARSSRPSFAALGQGTPSAEINQMTQHPPLYYLLLATVLRVLEPLLGEAGHDTVVSVLRTTSSLLVLPLPVIAYLVARRLGAPAGARVGAALVPLAIPQLVHIGASVNNDNLLILLLSTLTLLLLRAYLGPQRWIWTVAVGVVGGAALLTKGLALFVPAWIALAYLFAWQRHGLVAAAHGASATAVTLAAGGWWWLRNAVLHGQLQPYGAPLPDYRSEAFVPLLQDWLPHFLSRMALRFWGSMGWFSVHLPWWVVWVATALAAAAVLVAAVSAVRRHHPPWPALALLLAPLAALLLGTAAASWQRYAARGSVGGIQGRYLFGGVTGVAVVIAQGATDAARSLQRVVPGVIALGAVALHAVAIPRLTDHYWVPSVTADTGWVASVLAWYPWPPVVAAAGPALVVAGSALLLWALRDAASRRPATH